jgi:hypothetical protein
MSGGPLARGETGRAPCRAHGARTGRARRTRGGHSAGCFTTAGRAQAVPAGRPDPRGTRCSGRRTGAAAARRRTARTRGGPWSSVSCGVRGGARTRSSPHPRDRASVPPGFGRGRPRGIVGHAPRRRSLPGSQRRCRRCSQPTGEVCTPRPGRAAHRTAPRTRVHGGTRSPPCGVRSSAGPGNRLHSLAGPCGHGPQRRNGHPHRDGPASASARTPVGRGREAHGGPKPGRPHHPAFFSSWTMSPGLRIEAP